MELIERTVQPEDHGHRLDHLLAAAHPDLSRTEIQREIRAGRVRIAEAVVDHPSHRVRTGDRIAWEIPEKETLTPEPLAEPLVMLHNDDEMLVIHKPAGLVVHPGAGTRDTTLVEALLAEHTLAKTDDPERPGVVHRLDKETSGVIVMAKTESALKALQAQFAERSVIKQYLAVVEGTIAEEEGWIEAPIGRDPARPSRMAIQARGKHAESGFLVLDRADEQTLVLVRLHTGRTHQIRVHMKYIGHPVVGDSNYGHGKEGDRMLLHAWRLEIAHPSTGERLRFEAEIPAEFPAYAYDDVAWNAVRA